MTKCALALSSVVLLIITISPAMSEDIFVKCYSPEQLTNTMTPVELYGSAATCMTQEKFSNAFVVYGLASTFSKFDTMRVIDVTSHDAPAVLKNAAFSAVPPDKRTAFQKYAGPLFNDKVAVAKLCKDIATVGYPRYYPRYMVNHGLQAFTETLNGDGIVQQFNNIDAWKETLSTFLHCEEI